MDIFERIKQANQTTPTTRSEFRLAYILTTLQYKNGDLTADQVRALVPDRITEKEAASILSEA